MCMHKIIKITLIDFSSIFLIHSGRFGGFSPLRYSSSVERSNSEAPPVNISAMTHLHIQRQEINKKSICFTGNLYTLSVTAHNLKVSNRTVTRFWITKITCTI